MWRWRSSSPAFVCCKTKACTGTRLTIRLRARDSSRRIIIAKSMHQQGPHSSKSRRCYTPRFMGITLPQLRRYAVARSLFPPVTLAEALERMGFVQADPIRAPARAQDLILRHRVQDYRAGDLEQQYEQLDIAEDTFINYGFVTSSVEALMQPRKGSGAKWGDAQWSAAHRRRARQLLAFLRERGTAHPREVDERFAHGTVTNYWGGSSSATTFLLDAMHYRGMVRIARREAGVRIYAAHDHSRAETSPQERLDALVDAGVGLYAPL